MQFEFDDLLLDTRRGDLRLGGNERPLEPRAFALLCLLVENHDRLVSKDEILEKVWDGRIVTDSAVSTVVKAVRKALGDDGDAQKYVRTIRGRGFRFVAPVRIRNEGDLDLVAAHPARSEAEHRDAMPLDSKPSIAVLPFSVVGFSDRFSAIGDALPTELISSLSRLRWLRVIARGSSFRFRSRELDPNADRQQRDRGAGAAYSAK